MTTNPMRLYEGMFLLDAREARREGSDLFTRVQDLLRKHGGTIERADEWEERKLAFEVGGQKRALYYLSYFRAPTDAIPSLRSEAAILPGILRVLFLQVDAIPSEDLFHRREPGGPEEERGTLEGEGNLDFDRPGEGRGPVGMTPEGAPGRGERR